MIHTISLLHCFYLWLSALGTVDVQRLPAPIERCKSEISNSVGAYNLPQLHRTVPSKIPI